MAMNVTRNREGLTERDIWRCINEWEVIGGDKVCVLDTTSCATGSKTAFVEPVVQGATVPYVRLGADVLPDEATQGLPPDLVPARRRLSMRACLAHELAHALRYVDHGFNRSVELPDGLLDEAEASIHASFNIALTDADRKTLIEDARDQLQQWLSAVR